MAFGVMSTVRRSVFAFGLGLFACANEPASVVQHPPPREHAPRAPTSPSTGCSDEELGRQAQSVLRGSATYYHDSLAGNPTASGAPYDPDHLTAAHRTLPFGTRLRVSRTDVDLPPVCVTVNDRGPFSGRRRIVDLSRRAAEALHMVGKGVVPVRVDVF
jgi:rare lipoprotein A (peptidoglycan hydrolase)